MTAQPDFWHQLPAYLGEGLILTLWYGFLQGLRVLCFPGRAGRILLDGVFAFSAILLFFSLALWSGEGRIRAWQVFPALAVFLAVRRPVTDLVVWLMALLGQLMQWLAQKGNRAISRVGKALLAVLRWITRPVRRMREARRKIRKPEKKRRRRERKRRKTPKNRKFMKKRRKEKKSLERKNKNSV